MHLDGFSYTLKFILQYHGADNPIIQRILRAVGYVPVLTNDPDVISMASMCCLVSEVSLEDLSVDELTQLMTSDGFTSCQVNTVVGVLYQVEVNVSALSILNVLTVSTDAIGLAFVNGDFNTRCFSEELYRLSQLYPNIPHALVNKSVEYIYKTKYQVTRDSLSIVARKLTI